MYRYRTLFTCLIASAAAFSASNEPIRFLGKGPNAIVREGSVLVAPSHEYNHFLMRAAVFVFALGLNELNEYCVRGVIIDHPTPFTIGEMSGVEGKLGENLLWRGGDMGNEAAILLHSCDETEGEMIGMSGIYQGGLQDATKLVDSGKVTGDGFKFFFNYIEFTESELDNLLKDVDSDGDAWASVEVNENVILSSEYGRGECWSMLRNKLRDQGALERSPEE